MPTAAVGCEDYSEGDYIRLHAPDATFDTDWLLPLSLTKAVLHFTTINSDKRFHIGIMATLKH